MFKLSKKQIEGIFKVADEIARGVEKITEAAHSYVDSSESQEDKILLQAEYINFKANINRKLEAVFPDELRGKSELGVGYPTIAKQLFSLYNDFDSTTRDVTFDKLLGLKNKAEELQKSCIGIALYDSNRDKFLKGVSAVSAIGAAAMLALALTGILTIGVGVGAMFGMLGLSALCYYSSRSSEFDPIKHAANEAENSMRNLSIDPEREHEWYNPRLINHLNFFNTNSNPIINMQNASSKLDEDTVRKALLDAYKQNKDLRLGCSTPCCVVYNPTISNTGHDLHR
jgi:hypothetical protein